MLYFLPFWRDRRPYDGLAVDGHDLIAHGADAEVGNLRRLHDRCAQPDPQAPVVVDREGAVGEVLGPQPLGPGGSGEPRPMTWEGNRRLGPIVVSTDHKAAGGKMRLWFTDVSATVDGKVDAQPLYVSGVSIPGQGIHNVLYVATENDSLYAFDADNGALIWHDGPSGTPTSLLGPGETPPNLKDYLPKQVDGQYGFLATPVIDPTTGEVYAQAPKSGDEDIDRAYAAADAAFEGWGYATPQDRSNALLKLAAAIEDRVEGLCQGADDHGKSKNEMRRKNERTGLF